METTHKSEHRKKRRKKRIFVADQVDKESGPSVTQIIVALAIFIAVVWLTRYISLGSVLASLALPPLAYLTGSPAAAVAAASVAATFIIFRHRSNMTRLRARTEPRMGARA